ncbi:MAG: peptidylprolyl isomerase [Thermoplasmata archaeon]|jgi:FKBP-type peptidyl-prolyl cis-trans isomerase 2|nr:peptidylprolyl isomerase [Thermoplasmata archaeon]
MNKGDIVRVDYTLWTLEQDKEEIKDTTIEQVAKDNGIHDPNKRYSPEVIIIGQKMVLDELEKAIMNAELGKEYDVYLEPSQAYGERKPSLLKVYSPRDFERNKITPEVGKFVTINGQNGKVVSISPGRILVDFNNPLAGKKLHYKFIVREVVEGLENKILAIIEASYNRDINEFKVKEFENYIEIILADSCKYRPEWASVKYFAVGLIRDYTDKEIRLVELYEAKKPEEKKQEENKN